MKTLKKVMFLSLVLATTASQAESKCLELNEEVVVYTSSNEEVRIEFDSRYGIDTRITKGNEAYLLETSADGSQVGAILKNDELKNPSLPLRYYPMAPVHFIADKIVEWQLAGTPSIGTRRLYIYCEDGYEGYCKKTYKKMKKIISKIDGEEEVKKCAMERINRVKADL